MYKKYATYVVLMGLMSLGFHSTTASIDNVNLEKTLTVQREIAKKVLDNVATQGIAVVAVDVSNGKYNGPNGEFEVALFHPELTVAATSGLGIPNSEANDQSVVDPNGIEIGKMMEDLPVGGSKYKIFEGLVGEKIVPVRAFFVRGEKALVVIKLPAPNIHVVNKNAELIPLIRKQK